MPEIAGARALYSAQRQFRREAVTLFGEAGRRASRLLLAAADSSGVIPRSRASDVVRDVGEIALRLFVGRDGRSAYGKDGVTALAEFPDALNTAVATAAAGVVRAHHDWLKRHVPDDVFAWLASAAPVREQTARDPTRLFHPNPLAQVDRLHAWVDPNGYVLSDRIWQAGTRTRLRLDALVAEGVRNGTSAFNLSRQVERFLLPNRAPLRTRRPYGSDASYDGMRLARTEITAAHGRVVIAAARANPYVGGIRWRLSASHPKTDRCDDRAAGSPYPLDDVPPYPDHPYCLCCLIPVVVESVSAVTADLRELMEAGEAPPYVTPANYEGFLVSLLGSVLVELVRAA